MRKTLILLLLLAAPVTAQLRDKVRVLTVAQLPAACTAARIYNVIDGNSTTDCTTGGSTNAVWCQCDSGGASYTGISVAAGGGDVTDVGDCATGACFTAAGTGNSLVFEGATADGFETTLTATDPGADFTLTLPAETGTLVTSGNIAISDLANGTDGELVTWDSSGVPTTVPVGTVGQVLTSAGAGAEPTFQAAAGGGLSNIVEDVSPQLGAQLDINGFALGDGTLELLTFSETGSAINHVQLANAAIGNGPTISAVGDDTDVPLIISAKGSGVLTLEGGGDSSEGLIIDYSDGATDNPLTIGDGQGTCPDGPCFASLDDDLALYASNNTLYWSTGTSVFTVWQSLWIANDGQRPYLVGNVDATSTQPGFAWGGDADTGMGQAGLDQLSLIAGAVEALRATETAGAIVITFHTDAAAPGTCSIGDFYVDTSGAFCACTAANTWSNMTATGACT